MSTYTLIQIETALRQSWRAGELVIPPVATCGVPYGRHYWIGCREASNST